MAGEILVSARRIPRQDTMRSEPGAYVCEWTTMWSVLRDNPKNFSNNQAFCRRKNILSTNSQSYFNWSKLHSLQRNCYLLHWECARQHNHKVFLIHNWYNYKFITQRLFCFLLTSIILLHCSWLDNVNELRLTKENACERIRNQTWRETKHIIETQRREKLSPWGKLRQPKIHPHLAVLPTPCSLLHLQNLKVIACD